MSGMMVNYICGQISPDSSDTSSIVEIGSVLYMTNEK